MVLKYQFQTLLTLRAPEIILLPPCPCTVVIWNYDVIVIVVLKCRPSGCLDVSPVSLKIWMKMASLLLFEVNNWHILILTVVCVIYMWSETHISGLHDTTIEIEKFPIFLMSWKWSAFRVFLSRNFLKSLQPAPCLNFSFIWKKNISWWKKKKAVWSVKLVAWAPVSCYRAKQCFGLWSRLWMKHANFFYRFLFVQTLHGELCVLFLISNLSSTRQNSEV